VNVAFLFDDRGRDFSLRGWMHVMRRVVSWSTAAAAVGLAGYAGNGMLVKLGLLYLRTPSTVGQGYPPSFVPISLVN
jgi:hypothetical protein